MAVKIYIVWVKTPQHSLLICNLQASNSDCKIMHFFFLLNFWIFPCPNASKTIRQQHALKFAAT